MKRMLPAALMALAATAQAQAPNIPESAYRKDQAEVLTPAPPPASGPSFSSAAFSAAYAKAGRPTMAVLWNREFADMLQQSSAQQVKIDTTAAGVATQQGGRISGSSSEAAVVGGAGWAASERSGRSATFGASEQRAAVVGNTTITAQDTKTTQAQRRGPVERVDLQMRSSFFQTITSSGVKVVDRNVVMRTTAACHWPSAAFSGRGALTPWGMRRCLSVMRRPVPGRAVPTPTGAAGAVR